MPSASLSHWMVFSAMSLFPIEDSRYTRSMIVATPMPPPMHSVISARRALRRSSSSTMVPAIIAPVAPSGWPIAMAPPLTFSFSSGMSRSFWNFSTTDAKASLSSNRSMSSTVRPARSSTLRVAGVGPVSMMTGSEPLVAVATMRARGVNPCDWPALSLPTSTNAAPSTDPGLFAAGVNVFDLLDPVILLQRPVVEAAHRADPVERGLQLCQTLHRGVGTHVLVVVEDQESVLVTHRHDGLREITTRPGLRRFLLRPQRIGVDVLAGEALDSGDQVGADPLRDEADLVVGLRVGRPRAAIGAHRNP